MPMPAPPPADADPLNFRPSLAMAESLAWILETLLLASGRRRERTGIDGRGVDWPGVLALLARERGLLQEGAPALQRRLAALQEAGALTTEQAASLALAQPRLLRAAESTLREEGSALRVWTQVVGLPLQDCLAQYSEAVKTGKALAAHAEPELRSRLAALQRAVGGTREQAAAVAFAQPELLQTAESTLQEAITRLQQMVPATQLAEMLQQDPQQLAASLRHSQEMVAVLRQWTEVRWRRRALARPALARLSR